MRFLIYSNLFIAGCAAAMVHVSYLSVGTGRAGMALMGTVASATLLVYIVDRLLDVDREPAEADSERHRWIRRRRPWLVGLAGLAAVGTGLSALGLDAEVFFGLVPLAAIAGAYSFPLWPNADGGGRLKDVPGLKGVVVAVVWTGATAVLPVLDTVEWPWPGTAWGLMVERFFFILALTLPFDVRDLDQDRNSGLATVPMWLGVRGTRMLALGALGVSGLAAVGFRSPVGALAVVGALLPTAWLIAGVTERRGELYYVGALDGMMLLQWGLLGAALALV